MAKTKISEYSSTANSNTDIASINIDEGCAPSGINNAIRALMAQIHDLYAGTSGDTWPVTAGGTGSGTASGARTNLGLVIGTDVQAYDADLAAIASSGKGAEIASYGTYGVGFKNRIINGAMMIDQRNAGASVTPTDGQYTLDRWKAGASAASKFSVQQSTTAPAGFNFSMLLTSLSAYSVGTNDNFEMFQLIEGFNSADLGWGTANAQTITIGFWARSSLTGTHGGSVMNGAFNRSYPFTYTINAANTFEFKTVTVAGDTSGTWVGATNGTGLVLCVGLGAGSGRSGTAGTWAGATYYNATGAQSLVGTSGATLYITGVQLEKGSTATSFDYRPYGTELALCQRYYEKGFFNNACSVLNLATGIYSNATQQSTPISFKVTKRATPTVTETSVIITTGGNWVDVGIGSISSEFYTTVIQSNASTSNYAIKAAQYSASAEL